MFILLLKGTVFLLLTMGELLGEISSRVITKMRNEGCGEYGFVCLDGRSYHFCTISENERASDDAHDGITSVQMMKREMKNLCPENTVCDESNVFYCSHFIESPAEKESKIVDTNDDETKDHGIAHLSKINVPLKLNKDKRSVHETSTDLTDLEDVPECIIYGPGVEQEKREETSELGNTNQGLKSKEESLHGSTSSKVFRCKGPGKFPDPNCCNVYYECEYSNGDAFVPVRKTCSKRQVFDKSVNKCVPPSNIHSRNSSKEEEFSCPSEGKFPDPKSCFKYYVCDLSRNGCEFTATLHCCENGMIFDPALDNCAPKKTIVYGLEESGKEITSKPDLKECTSECTTETPTEQCTTECTTETPTNECTTECTTETPTEECTTECTTETPTEECTTECTTETPTEECTTECTTEITTEQCTTECSTEHICTAENNDKEITDLDKCGICKGSNSEYDTDTDTDDHYDCYREGNFPDPNDCSKYFTCKRRPNACGYISTHNCCGQGKVFDSMKGSCVCKPKIKSRSKIIFDKFPCFVQGVFADTDNKSNFYSCDLRPDGKGYVATRHCCGSDKVYNRIIKRCVCLTHYERKRQALRTSPLGARLKRKKFTRKPNTKMHPRYSYKHYNKQGRERQFKVFKGPSTKGTFNHFYRKVPYNRNHGFTTKNNRKKFQKLSTSYSFRHMKLNGENT